MTLSTTFITLYTGAVVSVSFAGTLFVLRNRLTLIEEAKLIVDRVDAAGGDWWRDGDPRDGRQQARRRAFVAFWRQALDRRRSGGSRWRSTGPTGDPAPPAADVAYGSAQVRPTRRPEADPEVTAYLDVVRPYPEIDYHGRHTATGAYPQVPSTRQAYP